MRERREGGGDKERREREGGRESISKEWVDDTLTISNLWQPVRYKGFIFPFKLRRTHLYFKRKSLKMWLACEYSLHITIDSLKDETKSLCFCSSLTCEPIATISCFICSSFKSRKASPSISSAGNIYVQTNNYSTLSNVLTNEGIHYSRFESSSWKPLRHERFVLSLELFGHSARLSKRNCMNWAVRWQLLRPFCTHLLLWRTRMRYVVT